MVYNRALSRSFVYGSRILLTTIFYILFIVLFRGLLDLLVVKNVVEDRVLMTQLVVIQSSCLSVDVQYFKIFAKGTCARLPKTGLARKDLAAETAGEFKPHRNRACCRGCDNAFGYSLANALNLSILSFVISS